MAPFQAPETMLREYPFKNIGMEVTSHCNTDCIVCPRGSDYDGPVQTMPMDLFEKIMIELHDQRLERSVRFSGMGDPSVDKFLLQRLRFCKTRTPGIEIVVLSNMGAWRQSYSEAIVEENLLARIRFSVFAVSEETSLKIYGDRRQAARTRRQIDCFVDKNLAAGHPVRMSLYTLLLPENEHEMNRIKEAYWDRMDECELWRPHNWSNLKPGYREVQSARLKCRHVEEFGASIRVNGDVCACSMDINHHLVYGNLRNQSLKEIFQSDPYQRLRDLNRKGCIEMLDTCRGCSYLNADQSDVLIESKQSERGNLFHERLAPGRDGIHIQPTAG